MAQSINDKISAYQADQSHNSSKRDRPAVFIADTDSVRYVIDTGTNRMIVNDVKLMTKFVPRKIEVKGINGEPTLAKGTGLLNLPLKADQGSTHVVSNLPAVYIPACPYNLLSPQYLIKEMRQRGFDVKDFKHDDQNYVLQYSRKRSGQHLTLTCPIRENDLFEFRTKDGYENYNKRVSSISPEWTSLYGDTMHKQHTQHSVPNVVSDDESSVGSSDDKPSPENNNKETIPQARESVLQTRETRLDTREMISASETGTNVSQRKTPMPITFDDADFCQECDKEAEDHNVLLNRRKQIKLLTIHEKLGHLSFSVLKLLAKCNVIPRELADVDPPLCPGCAYGKAHRKPWRVKGRQNRRKLREAKAPGDVVSIDQLVSPTPGFVPLHRGKPTNKRYVGATVYVDHFSDFTYVHLMDTLDAETTVESKNAFERISAAYNVKIRHYHADNGLFDTKAFRNSVEKAGQTISFCGVNAHHQNGKAENRIKDVTTGARTALLHASHRWPKAIHASLWPSALKHYVNLRNDIPTEFNPLKMDKHDKRRIKQPATYTASPLSKFSGVETPLNINKYHPFGCPVYVLESNLQEKKSHNKWTDRTRVGIFLCHSPSHAGEVPLVLNTNTANVSPQFHCLYDDEFASCHNDPKFISLWQHKAKLKRIILKKEKNSHSEEPMVKLEPRIGPFVNEILPEEFYTAWENTIQEGDKNGPKEKAILDDTTGTNDNNNNGTITTRSGRVVKKPEIYNPSEEGVKALMAYDQTFGHTDKDDSELLQPSIQNTEEQHPLVSMISEIVCNLGADPDTMYLNEAMAEPDREQFIDAMKKELLDHINRKHWKVVPIKSIPKGKKCLPMVWSMKRKRNPIGEITKWKARLCAGGHKSVEFVDYWDTYSPVVAWQTVRLIFILAIINQWHIKSVDFILAYPQAEVKTDIYMSPPRVPKDFIIPDLPNERDRKHNVYKLLRNLYGLKDAGRTWNQFIHAGLIKRGWTQCRADECLYIKNGMILTLYVDDACIISPSLQKIDVEIQSLKKDYALTDDGALTDYLGTRFNRRKDGTIELTQPRLIERVLQMVGLDSKDEKVKLHNTPAATVLHKNSKGKPRKQHWNYRSAVGCLSYIQAMIRPDITMAVQQCAKFNNAPTQEHEEAVKRICRYLKRTKDKGLIFKPDKSKGLECYVDADFAGSWEKNNNNDEQSVYSRSGFCIFYGGCPILWKSKTQSLIALSTTEAEYVALSTALREVIAILQLLEELNKNGLPIHKDTPKFVCKTYEDNKSCISIANDHRTRPRTKHFALKLHHFRSYIVNKTISIDHVSTTEQIADIFTKPLPRVQFERLRRKLMTW